MKFYCTQKVRGEKVISLYVTFLFLLFFTTSFLSAGTRMAVSARARVYVCVCVCEGVCSSSNIIQADATLLLIHNI